MTKHAALAPRIPRLVGRQIVVTRAHDQAASLTERLRAEGARPLLVPAITTRAAPLNAALADALRTLSTFDWIVWTSRNGFHYAWPHLRDHLAYNRPPDLRLAVIGPGTEDALAGHDLQADFVPTEHRAEVLADTLPVESGARVLLCRGNLARAELPHRLTERGALVTEVTVYETVADAAPERVKRAMAAGPDAVTFTSPSTVRGFMEAYATAWPDAVQGVAIGSVTAEAMHLAAVPVHAVAHPHTLDGLIDALIDLFPASV